MSKVEGIHRIQVIDQDLSIKDVIRKILSSEEIEDAFYVCDVSDIVRKFTEWRNVLPRVTTYYEVKCNPHRVVLETLAALGSCFTCSSKEEIRKILSLGVTPDRILYGHPAKKFSHLRYAAEVAVDTMMFDNEKELYKIKEHHPTARLLLHIKHDDPQAKFRTGAKFGADPDTEAKHLLQLAKELNLDVIGVSFHTGFRANNENVYSEAIAMARSVFDTAADLGYTFKLLDIGGDFSGDKGSLAKYANVINTALNSHFPDGSVKVISEPGQYFVGSAFTLVTQIHSKRLLSAKNGEEKLRMYYVDISIYNCLIIALYNIFRDIVPINSPSNGLKYPSTVWGYTCDGCDKLSPETLMLPDLRIGEWLTFENIGAYSLSVATDFNGIELPNVHSVICERDWRFLTDSAAYPLNQEKFVVDGDQKSFLVGLTTPSKFITNYY